MDIVVIGGGAAGMAAASKAKRINKDANVTVIESGSFVSYAECGIPYFLQGIVGRAEDLLHYPLEEFTEKRGIRVIIGRVVKKIDTASLSLILDNGSAIKFDRLIIATGARPRIPDGIASGVFGLRSLESAIRLRDVIDGSRTVTIIGAGVLGVELASTLTEAGKKVKVISKYDRVMPQLDPDIGKILNEYFSSRVEVEFSSTPVEIRKEDDAFAVKTTVDDHVSDVVIAAVGIVPNSNIAVDAGIKVDQRGAILTDDHMETSIPGIYAAGDVATVKNRITGEDEMMPLAQIANKAGRVAGSNAAGSEMKFPGALGSTLVKVFDMEVGFTGLNEKRASALGIPYGKTMIRAKSRANYYPGKEDIFVKILYDSRDRKIIGGQVMGKDGAAWRLNTLATAIFAGFTVEDLFYDDLGYTPPFGPVWDPLIIAGSVSMRE
ncbi:FAD-dependent oxidoreductase [Thermoplasma sp.]|uniref:FAD-dependent oxidoreductase n=1 Tax=Thermoplasma sp. TaxID=1973142 RepID=UPI001281CD29|nr:FAD-dependent oxidoreductase [Thermoplasma sp.]KAA8923088.1 MAG: FAD-binding protein [Thermoplasma sp.]